MSLPTFSPASATASATPPRSEKRSAQETHHGITRDDEYAWLRDDNWQAVMKQPELLQADIRSHLEA